MSQDRNPYYDSSRHKVDKSEFASLRMDIQSSRQRSSSGASGVVKIVVWVVVLVVIAAVAKRFLFT
ncbi:MAG: hypothetical protein JSS14_09485 [Proteobacteria bacterium]|nr:hypothetical protein [Pseudomonadota bacterium]